MPTPTSRDPFMTREEARVQAEKHRKRAKRAWEEEWDLKAEAFWLQQAEKVASAHGLTLQNVTCVGVVVGTRYL